jgi:hypothetical protein
MRPREKQKNIEDANKRLEETWLKSKVFLNEKANKILLIP